MTRFRERIIGKAQRSTLHWGQFAHGSGKLIVGHLAKRSVFLKLGVE